MSCHNKPEVTCGDLISDACVTISDTTIFKGCPSWISDYMPDMDCPRQSDLNKFYGLGLCEIVKVIGQFPDCGDPTVATGILGRIGLNCLQPCDPDLGAPFKPLGTGNEDAKVNDEFQNVYTALCDLKGTLNSWTDLPLPQGFDLGCIEDKCCGTPPTTLGTLLEAMIAKICCITANAVNSQGVVLNTPTTGACPNC